MSRPQSLELLNYMTSKYYFDDIFAAAYSYFKYIPILNILNIHISALITAISQQMFRDVVACYFMSYLANWVILFGEVHPPRIFFFLLYASFLFIAIEWLFLSNPYSFICYTFLSYVHYPLDFFFLQRSLNYLF